MATHPGRRTLTMSSHWMPLLSLSLTPEEFRQLPRNPAYRYEYRGGRAVLCPRPRFYHALLELQPETVDDPVPIEPLADADIPSLELLFADAFRSIQPFGSLEDSVRREAARQALERTCSGGDGPWIRPASFVARTDRGPVGAIFITLLPDADPCAWDSYHWQQPPPPDCIERRLGRPHLTWIFVSPLMRGHGVGTALLAAAERALLGLGYTQLLSTFMLGNESSMLWHWRTGFRLLAYPGSPRATQRPGG